MQSHFWDHVGLPRRLAVQTFKVGRARRAVGRDQRKQRDTSQPTVHHQRLIRLIRSCEILDRVIGD